MESDKDRKLSKHQRRKAQRYGKTYNDLSGPNNKKPHIVNLDSAEFISYLLKPQSEEDHSLDELEFKKRPWWILPGSFETGKRR
jgi:hypothetical protein